MIILPEQCDRCKHDHGKRRCDAFPGFPGIPQEIYDMEFDHRNPYPGDNGIRWEPKEEGVIHPFDEDSNGD
jgi:hypothetical protein